MAPSHAYDLHAVTRGLEPARLAASSTEAHGKLVLCSWRHASAPLHACTLVGMDVVVTWGHKARRVTVRQEVVGARTVRDNAQLVEHRELTADWRDGPALHGGPARRCGREGLEGARLEGAGRRGVGGGRREALASERECMQRESLWRAARAALSNGVARNA